MEEQKITQNSEIDIRKVAVIGCGFVGSASAFAPSSVYRLT